MAWENFGFFHAVKEYTKCKPEQKSKAKEIFEEYIKVDAIHELGDLDYSTRTYIEEQLENPPADLFDELSDIAADSLANATVADFLRDPVFHEHNAKSLENNGPRRNGFIALFPCISA